ncbi:flagellar biosynthesis protein FlhF [Limnobacter humi]|uniref:Flagellar biosynthesis protein FlhF n=1 Tax=Limnobacter humi TaxID=1778671 RepID=A0ABT1WIM3_9BURK|nr:flagellar biosynthesis protein FlhF [Limnobacter humi]MCQ8897375.1 flagellar biosynthesis protein FlhF [Limnobacter humi]
MKLKKFTASTTREALQKLRAELGEDAIILSTKRTAAGTEVLAAASQDLDDVAVQAEKPQAQTVSPASWTRNERQQYETLSKPAPQASRADLVAQQVAAQRSSLLSPSAPSMAPEQRFEPDDMMTEVGRRRAQAASQAMVNEQAAVLEEIKQMRQLLKDQMNLMTWRDSLEKNPLKAELWNHLSNAGFSPLFARTVVDKLPAGLTENQAMEWIQSVLKKNLAVVDAQHDMVETGGTYALVGPTGVGKTTTTAKLAARCVVKYGADSLGLITTDSYRVGAQDQLRIYGKILGVQVYTAQNHADLQQLRTSLQRKRLILIDTVGMGQRDSRVAEHTKILTDSHVKRVLLLNATSQTETLDDVVRHYKSTGLDGAIVSKLDEAIKLGGVLDVVMRHKLRLHYIATGQRVPEDLFLADARVLVHRALKNRASQAFSSSDEELKWKMAQVSTTGL